MTDHMIDGLCDEALEKEIREALAQADRLIEFFNVIPRPSAENIRQANLDITRGENVSLVWKNMSKIEKQISSALDASEIDEGVRALLWHVTNLKKVVIAQSYCNDHLVERIEALENKVNKAPHKDAAEMRKAASMLYARAKQLEGE